jgi:hypothetical protein
MSFDTKYFLKSMYGYVNGLNPKKLALCNTIAMAFMRHHSTTKAYPTLESKGHRD